MLLLTSAIATTMGGALYTSVRTERAEASKAAQRPPVAIPSRQDAELSIAPPADRDVEHAPEPDAEPPANTEAFDPVISVEIDLGEATTGDPMDLYPEYLDPSDDTLLPGGVHLGPMAFGPYEEPPEPEAETLTASSEARGARARRRARRAPPQPSWPRLHPDPGMNSILTARRMIANHELIQGSCYHYLSVVYERAGHRSWRRRRIVYHEGRDGPYADLSLIRPGDWLYIVNDPGRTPVGTHSVMFVGWDDRARGWARVISHAGWGPPRAGREGTYDVTRTYRIIRPTM